MRRIGLVFDFDGTIALSEPVHAAAWRDLAAAAGLRLPEGFEEYGIGRTDAELAARLAGTWGGVWTEGKILKEKREFYLKRCLGEAPLVPGVLHFIGLVHRAGLPIGLATSASLEDVTPTLDGHGLRRFFQSILTVESVVRPKPAPEIYLRSAAALRIDPESAFAFEDSPTGAAAARAAGFQVIGVTTTYEPDELGPLTASIPDFTGTAMLLDLLNLNSFRKAGP